MPQIPTEATKGPPFSVLNQCPQLVTNAHHCVIEIEKQLHAITLSRSPSALMERPKRMRILPTTWKPSSQTNHKVAGSSPSMP